MADLLIFIGLPKIGRSIRHVTMQAMLSFQSVQLDSILSFYHEVQEEMICFSDLTIGKQVNVRIS